MKDDKGQDAWLYWSIVSDARLTSRKLGPQAPEMADAIDELEVIQKFTDWPMLRRRTQLDIAELSAAQGRPVEAEAVL